MTDNRVRFEIEVIGPAGSQRICAFICSPAIEDDQPDFWTCRVGWSGPLALERPGFGATALQALNLAIPLLEGLLQMRFPDAEFLMSGRPFFLKPSDQ